MSWRARSLLATSRLDLPNRQSDGDSLQTEDTTVKNCASDASELPRAVTRTSRRYMPFIALGMALLCMLSACEAEAPAQSVATSSRTARIMPLGDSITESSKGRSSYRYYLWKLALARGYRIDLVGSQHGVARGAPLHSDFDMDHEGHSGWRADEILAQIATWSTQTRPDFVLIHLGHNDLCQGQSVQSTVDELGAIIDTLRGANARVVIFLAQVIASAAPCHSQIPVLNAQLLPLAEAKRLPLSPVVIVDQHSNFDPNAMTHDRVHPNAAGESQMADRWMASLSPFLDGFFGNPLPSSGG